MHSQTERQPGTCYRT